MNSSGRVRDFSSVSRILLYEEMKHGKMDEDGQNVRDKLQELENQHHGHHHLRAPTSMPLLNRCCCFSLLTGAVFTGIYATVRKSLCSYSLSSSTVGKTNQMASATRF